MEEYVMWSPVGPLRLCQEDGAIVGLYFGGTVSAGEPPTALLRKAQAQLIEYFNRQRTEFDLPLCFGGTDFQHAVWEALLDIPYGETRTYGQIAAAIGRPKAEVVAARVKDINPDCEVKAIRMFYLPQNADQVDLSQYDYVVDCIDTVAAKLE